VIVAVNQVGGLPVAHAAESRRLVFFGFRPTLKSHLRV